MASHRTTIMLDEASRRAAKELATALEVAPAEAVRRAIVAYRDQVLGASPDWRKQRLRSFKRALDLFADHDAKAEVAALKQQDEHF